MAVETSQGAASTPPVPPKPPKFPWGALLILVAGAALWVSTGGSRAGPALGFGAMLVVVGFFAYIVAPIRLRNTYWLARTPEIRAIDLDASDTPGVSAGHKAMAEALGPLGFVDLGHYALEGSAPNILASVGVFDNASGRTVARWFHFKTPKGIETILGFTTRFADGTEVTTGNARVATSAPPPRTTRGYPFPGVDDPARLLALHRRALAEVGEFSSSVPLLDGGPVAFLARSITEGSDHLVKIGEFRPDGASGRIRPTFKGAFLMACRQFWPWGPIRRALRRRRAARRLRAWEIPAR